MIDMLDTVLTLNVALSVGVLLVLLLRGTVRRYVGANAAYGLWALPIALMGATLLPAQEVWVTLPAAEPTLGALPLPDLTAAPASSDPKALPLEQAVSDVWNADHSVWLMLIGAVAMFALMGVRQFRFERSLKNGFQHERAGLRCLSVRSLTYGPALVGILRSRLLLPDDFERRFSVEEQHMVLTHERAHAHRFDPIVNGLVAGLICLFWYNPLMHLAARKIRIDQEMACDARVLGAGHLNRKAYASALLKAQMSDMPPFVCAWPASSESALKSRITAMRHIKGGGIARFGGLFAVFLAALLGSATWAIKPSDVHYTYEAEPGFSLLPAANATSDNEKNTDTQPETDSKGTEISRSGQTSFIDELAEAGLRDLDVETLLALKIHGLNGPKIEAYRDVGLEITASNLVSAAVSGLEPEDIKTFRERHPAPEGANTFALDLETQIRLRHLGVTSGDWQAFNDVGLPLLSSEIMVQFVTTGVTPDYIKRMRAAGVDAHNRTDWVAAKIMGIDVSYVEEARDHGFECLTLDQLIIFKKTGAF